MAELLSICYVALFAASGIGISRLLFTREKPLVRIWLGLALGMAMLIWFPALFSFVLGFYLPAQLLGLLLACLLGGAGYYFSRNRSLTDSPWKAEIPFFIAGGVVLAICLVLLSTHTIVLRDGALYVGQSTYGDLAMHLGFISSIAVHGTFPPM